MTKGKSKIVKLAGTSYFRRIRVSSNSNRLVQFNKVPRVRIPLSPGYNDLYPFSPVGQLAWPYNLYLLHIFKNERYDALDYAAMYLLAFPQLLDDFEETHFATAELNFFRAYAIRAIERFLVWFGFVKYQPGINIVEKDVVVKPLLWEVFDFD